MKKFTLVIAVLAVVSFSLISFTKSKAHVKEEKYTEYCWIRYGCQSYGASSPIYPSEGMNYVLTTDPGMLQGNCPEMQSSGVCAVRFLRSEVTCNQAWATPNVNPWDGNHLIKYCSL